MNNQQIRNAWLTSIGIWYKKNPNLLCEFIFGFSPFMYYFLILSHKCWEKRIYGLLPTFLN